MSWLCPAEELSIESSSVDLGELWACGYWLCQSTVFLVYMWVCIYVGCSIGTGPGLWQGARLILRMPGSVSGSTVGRRCRCHSCLWPPRDVRIQQMYLMSITTFFISRILFSLNRYAIFLAGERRPLTPHVLKSCEVAVKELNSGLCPSSLIFKPTSKVSWRRIEATGSAGLAPLTFRAAPPRNKARRFPLISAFESHRRQSLKRFATFLATLLRYLPEALGGSGQGSDLAHD